MTQLVEQIDVGIFPNSWTLERVDAIFDLQHGAALSPKRRKGINPHPFLRTLNVLWGYLDLSIVDCMDFSPDEVAKLTLKQGDLLVCEGGEIGRTAMWNDELQHCCYQNHIHRLRSNGTHQIIPEFYMYWMQAAFLLLNRYRGQGNKTTIPNLSGSRLNSFVVPNPPFQEQRAIARALGAVQEAKAARQREIELEHERKAALMQKLFSYGTRGDFTKQTQIGKIPINWKAARLSEFSERPVYGFTTSALSGSGETKLLRITDIQQEKVAWDVVPYCACDDEIRQKYGLKTGDILIARIGATTGKTFLVKDAPTAIFASYLMRIRTGPDLLPTFLSFCFQTDSYWMQIDQRKGGRLKAGINIPILENLIIPLPPLTEQQEMSDILQACDAKLSTLDNEIKLLSELFAAMLEELMTGKISVEPLTEVAEA